jgi:hypothetical protein
MFFDILYIGLFNLVKKNYNKYPKITYVIGPVCFIAFQLSINLLTISLLLEEKFGVNLRSIIKYYFIVILPIILIYFFRNKKYLKIETKYVNETIKHKLITKLITLLYFVLTFGSFFIIAAYYKAPL